MVSGVPGYGQGNYNIPPLGGFGYGQPTPSPSPYGVNIPSFGGTNSYDSFNASADPLGLGSGNPNGSPFGVTMPNFGKAAYTVPPPATTTPPSSGSSDSSSGSGSGDGSSDTPKAMPWGQFFKTMVLSDLYQVQPPEQEPKVAKEEDTNMIDYADE